MLPADRAQFVAILTGLAMMKPGGESKLTKESLDLWWAAMQHWDMAEFREAANHLVRSVEFMPSPFHFEQLRKAERPTAGEAWLLAKRSCCTARTPGGHDAAGTSGDPLVDRCVQMIGGYRAIAMANVETELPHIERRFCNYYDELGDVEETREAVPVLISREEARSLLGGIVKRVQQEKPTEGDAQ